MRHFLLPSFFLLSISVFAQDIPDPALRKPYKVVVQTGIALQWFDEQFKSVTLSAERPLNLYNHIGLQANFFFPNNDYYYRSITGNTWEVGFFSKSFFHGRLTGRRSKTYIGPDIRFGRREYYDRYYNGFENLEAIRSANTFKFMVRLGWQYHLGPAVIEIALPFGIENENFPDDNALPNQFYYGYFQDSKWFIVAPSLSFGVGF
jgi:hypothetical protein